jgi:hypothetical protein
MDYTIYYDILKRKEDQLGAYGKLNKAIEIFKECGASGWKSMAEKELSSVS